MKTMTIFGTRPEGIKMAPLVLELERDEEIENIIVNTAQHREMLDQVLQLFEMYQTMIFNQWRWVKH